MKLLLILLMLFIQSPSLTDLQKADEHNNEYCQGIIKGKIKSIQRYQIINGKITKKTKTITNFDMMGNVTEFITNNEVRHEFVYKNNKLERESFYDPTAPTKPYNDIFYSYNEKGVLIESRTENTKKKYVYQNGKLLKVEHYLDDKLKETDNYSYSKTSEQYITKDTKGALVKTSLKNFFPEERKVSHVEMGHKSKTHIEDQVFYDEHGDEINYTARNFFRKTTYLKYDSLGNWSSKLMYQNKDTIIVHRLLKFY